jgi:hypothetical protein
MKDEAPNQEEVTHHAGVLTTTALRAIDAGLGVLQRLRNRIEGPVADEEISRKGGGRGQTGGDEPPAIAASSPPRKTLLHRFLIVVMCLLMGGVAGMLTSYRGFSKQIESQANRIDIMQDEIKQSRTDEARNLHEKYKLQKEIAGYRNSLSEARQDVEDHKRQIAELNTRLSVTQEVGRPADQGRRAPKPVAIQARTPPKTGTCVTGTANPAGDLLDCIGKFNSQ